MLSPVLSASAEGGGDEFFPAERRNMGGGAVGQAPASGTAFADRSGGAGALRGGGVVGPARSAMYEAFKQVRHTRKTYNTIAVRSHSGSAACSIVLLWL